MGLYLPFLIAALLLLPGPASAVPQPVRCLACHQPHQVGQESCSPCHMGNSRTNRKELAHSGLIAGRYASFGNPAAPVLTQGTQLAERAACRRCHTLGATGNRLASNLDALFWTTSPETIRAALVKPALFMPDFQFNQRDLDSIVTVILAGGFKAGKPAQEPPQVVHFNLAGSTGKGQFAKQCGGCHKLLSRKQGGLGNGTAGPGLSGLFSRFYPATFADNRTWNEERLTRWLKNPRELRNQTLMRPVPLKEEELAELMKSFD